MKSNFEYCNFLGCYAEPAGEIRPDVLVERTLTLFSAQQFQPGTRFVLENFILKVP